MAYAIIPQNRFKDLEQPYKVINQIFTGDEESPVKLPYVLLEDNFNSNQETEILSLDGQIFENGNDYNDWLNSVI